MAIIVATNADTRIVLNTFDEFYIPEDVSVIQNTTGVTILSASQQYQTYIAIDGSAISPSNNALWLRGNADGLAAHQVVIGQTGNVRSVDRSAAVYAVDDRTAISNAGEISGGWGVFFENAETAHLINTGSITGQLAQDWYTSGNQSPLDGVMFHNATDVRLVNSGGIFGGDGVELSLASGEIINHGTIIGSYMSPDSTEDGIGIRLGNSSAPITVINTGLVSGTVDALLGGTGADRVENAGQFSGNVLLGLGNDRYTGLGTGHVVGHVSGGDGSDTLIGADGDDTLFGGNNNDLVMGGGGNDSLPAGPGEDTLRGGAGNDTIEARGRSTVDPDLAYGEGGDDSISLGGGHDTLRGGPGDDTLLGNTGNDLHMGGLGHDLIEGGVGRDTLMGQGGNDSLEGGLASDGLMGGNGYDLLLGDAGYDTLKGGLAGDTLDGGPGQDELWGQGGEDSLMGGDQSDSLYGGGLSDTLDGGAGFDLLDGGRGDDVLLGGNGNDTLTGGRGDDDLTGGPGEDVFVFGWANGDDVITDFQNTLDRIDLTALDAALPDVIAAVSAVGASAVMLDLTALGASGTVLIDGVPLAGIGGGDFIL